MLKRFWLLLLIVGLVLADCNVDPATPAPPGTLVPGQGVLKVAFLDVGQGDSILIQAPNGKIMLIDGGRTTDLAQRLILPQIKAWGANQVDVLVVTHPDADHISGLVGVLESFRSNWWPSRAISMPRKSTSGC